MTVIPSKIFEAMAMERPLTLLETVTPEPEPRNRDVVGNHRTPTEQGRSC